MLSLEQKICAWLKIDSLRITISISPDLWSRVRLPYKRIIVWHGTVVIQPQSLPRQRIELLRQLALGRIARRNVEFAVGSKPQTASRVKLRRGNVLDNHFAIGESVWRFAIAHHTHALSVFTVSIRKIKEMI